MGATQVVSGEAGHILQLKRSLLPIDEYAARRGISSEIIEKYRQLGIIQIRRYKGKTFVVDVPPGPYSCLFEGIREAVRHIDRPPRDGKISEPIQKITPPASISEVVQEMPDFDVNDDIGRVDEIPSSVQVINIGKPRSLGQSAQLTGDGNRAENFFEPTQILQRDPPAIIAQPTTPGDEKTRTEILTEPIQPPDWDIFESPDESSPLPEGRDEFPQLTQEDMKTEESPEPAQIPQENNPRLRTLRPQVESKQIWQLATIFSMAFLVSALFVIVGLYVDRQVQFAKLEMVYASIQKLHQEASQANEQLEALKSKLTESRAQVRQIRRELYSSRAEVKTVEKELARARENLRTIHQVNAEALERFNNQIENLITLTEQAERK